MGFLSRITNGWEIAKTSFTVLNANKELLIFPVLSGISMLLIIGSFVATAIGGTGWNADVFEQMSRGEQYLILFGFYIVNYFIVVFFNMGLMHCVKLYFDGEEVSVAKGLRFSVSRLRIILLWALFSATVGVALKILQDNLGWIGKILISLIGFVWSMATFFAVPVLAYENVGPIEALQRSANMMKEKWGESIGANFSIGLVSFAGMILIGVAALAITAFINEGVGIAIFALGFLAIIAVSSALHSIFISAVYNQMKGNMNVHFDRSLLDNLFQEKS